MVGVASPIEVVVCEDLPRQGRGIIDLAKNEHGVIRNGRSDGMVNRVTQV